ncbi:hypothetical protein [Cryobacterium mannosilyticum]|uniref:ATP-binding protein n=1 Tax=Cryobacterium mannosilyticum TaxID=1259190 RepID=A0A4R8W8I6_9MICO|nr:hypothetical protein [Cryobacterium mannosilyticum]TFC03773.1 hypothetical protein E3O32_09280 [Cryobacterium mannosilyticum]
MNTITKRLSAFGIAGIASAIIVGGLAAPAQASEQGSPRLTGTDGSSAAQTVDFGLLTDALTGNQATGTGVAGNDASLLGGGVLKAPLVSGPVVDRSLTGDVGDVASGNEVGNGTSIGNGNDVPVASGNDTSVTAPVEAPVTAPVGSGNDVTGGNVGDIGSSVNDVVDGSLGGLDLGAVLGR